MPWIALLDISRDADPDFASYLNNCWDRMFHFCTHHALEIAYSTPTRQEMWYGTVTFHGKHLHFCKRVHRPSLRLPCVALYLKTTAFQKHGRHSKIGFPWMPKGLLVLIPYPKPWSSSKFWVHVADFHFGAHILSQNNISHVCTHSRIRRFRLLWLKYVKLDKD